MTSTGLSASEASRLLEKYGPNSVEIESSETPTTIIAATPFEMKSKTNEVIYFWGAKSKGNLGFLRQEISTR
ncbi:MAG: cation-transporting P-type ATPase [Candidatus Nanopelagicaceae bacterium]